MHALCALINNIKFCVYSCMIYLVLSYSPATAAYDNDNNDTCNRLLYPLRMRAGYKYYLHKRIIVHVHQSQ